MEKINNILRGQKLSQKKRCRMDEWKLSEWLDVKKAKEVEELRSRKF